MTCFDDEDAVDSGEVSTLVLARSVPAAVEMDHQPEGSGNHLASTMPSAHERCESVRARIRLCARPARGPQWIPGAPTCPCSRPFRQGASFGHANNTQ